MNFDGFRTELISDRRVAGSLFDAMYEACHIFVDVMMVNAAEVHRFVAARTDDAITMHDAANAFAECGATFRAANADFHVVDGIVHDTGPAEPVDDEQT
jgi:precorrin isomerase